AVFKSEIITDKTNIIWKFRETEKPLDQWIVNCDGDYHHGYSTAKLELSTYGTGIFHGVLDTRIPKDGVTTNSGYCNITTVPKLKSFKRLDFYNWYQYNELILRIRGDGRCYMLNILPEPLIDITRYLGFHYFVYTRGGPYWQIVRIPFSKFLASLKGEIYENQFRMMAGSVKNFGITVADKKSGPFRLEIDYIAVSNNTNLFETFAYEEYKVLR
ncbi:putative complex I intermediate-associated protein 30, mitochondrial, partial [Eufriesea mexicana]